MREGYTLVPLDLYFENGRGRKSHDKRALIRERTEMREALQAMRRGTR